MKRAKSQRKHYANLAYLKTALLAMKRSSTDCLPHARLTSSAKLLGLLQKGNTDIAKSIIGPVQCYYNVTCDALTEFFYPEIAQEISMYLAAYEAKKRISWQWDCFKYRPTNSKHGWVLTSGFEPWTIMFGYMPELADHWIEVWNLLKWLLTESFDHYTVELARLKELLQSPGSWEIDTGDIMDVLSATEKRFDDRVLFVRSRPFLLSI